MPGRCRGLGCTSGALDNKFAREVCSAETEKEKSWARRTLPEASSCGALAVSNGEKPNSRHKKNSRLPEQYQQRKSPGVHAPAAAAAHAPRISWGQGARGSLMLRRAKAPQRERSRVLPWRRVRAHSRASYLPRRARVDRAPPRPRERRRREGRARIVRPETHLSGSDSARPAVIKGKAKKSSTETVEYKEELSRRAGRLSCAPCPCPAPEHPGGPRCYPKGLAHAPPRRPAASSAGASLSW